MEEDTFQSPAPFCPTELPDHCCRPSSCLTWTIMIILWLISLFSGLPHAVPPPSCCQDNLSKLHISSYHSHGCLQNTIQIPSQGTWGFSHISHCLRLNLLSSPFIEHLLCDRHCARYREWLWCFSSLSYCYGWVTIISRALACGLWNFITWARVLILLLLCDFRQVT